MPKAVHVSWEVTGTAFPGDTDVPELYTVSIDDPTSSPVTIPVDGPNEADFPAVAAGHWTVTVGMAQADGTVFGTAVTGEVDVPPDDVMVDVPIMVNLTAGG
jgi:hypothetical protein